MFHKILFIAAFLAAHQAHAGATNAEFSCVSDSGRTALQASVPGDFAEHQVTFTIDGIATQWFDTIEQTPPYQNVKNSVVAVLGNMKDRNYHFVILSLKDPHPVFTFSAVPSSINVKKTANGERGSLKAMIQGNDPRSSAGETSKMIQVNCQYTYEI